MLEHELGIRIGLGLRIGNAAAHRLRRLGLDLLRDLVAENAESAQVPLVPPETLVLLLLLDPLEVDVCTRVVGGGMWGDAVRDRFDERRTISGARITPAKLAPSWKAPSLVAPSPK